MAYHEQAKRAAEIMRERGVGCDCAWDTGDHAPECAVEAGWADAMDEAADEAFQAEEIEADRRASQFYGG